MRRLITLATVIALLFLSLGNDVARGQAPPAPVVRYQFRTEGLPLSGPFDVAHQILNFPPGASTPWHTHPGLVLVTVIEGEANWRTHDTEKLFKTGESFIETPNHMAQAYNPTSANTVALVSFVLPDGAPLSVPQAGDTTPPPRPSPGHQFRTDGLPVPAAYDVLHMVQDYPPGAATPLHRHPGQVLLTVLEGEITFRVKDTEQVFKAGESFVELPNEVAQARNATTMRATLMATALLPRGVPLSQPVSAPPAPLPNTGVEAAPVTFPETGYSLDGEFLAYWQAHGGLPVFGYPIDSARQLDGRVSQWLERARFELHPENAAPYHVLLGRLGVEALARQGRPWQTLPKAAPTAPHYFRETGHAIAHEPFWKYWTSHGLELDGRRGTSYAESLALFGYPISEAHMERNANGDRVLTQWFERARLEYHPTNPAAYRVLLGRLGAELQGRK